MILVQIVQELPGSSFFVIVAVGSGCSSPETGDDGSRNTGDCQSIWFKKPRNKFDVFRS